MQLNFTRTFVALSIVFIHSMGHPTELVGKVVGVLDGDTLDVLSSQKDLHRIRVSGIDAPEKGQAFGQASKRTMSEMAFLKIVTVTWRKRDRYGRIVGKAEVGGKDVGLAMVQNGMAWHYKQYQSEQDRYDRTAYSNAELTARAAKKGLWSDAVPIAPWDFRKSGGSHSAKENSTTCPCSSFSMCVGPRGGSFCFASNGKKQYQKKAEL